MTARRTVLQSIAGMAMAAALPARADSPAPPAEVLADLPGAVLLGSGRMRVLGFHICDARLWVRPGFTAASYEQQPLALELQYARSFAGRRIAERSLSEMKGVGTVPAERSAAWLAEMTAAFPDVEKGDRITGVHRPGESVRFFANGTLRREVRDAAFARLFFGIWLSPRTSEPGLRDALMGPSRAAP